MSIYQESNALDPYAWRNAWEPVLEAIEEAMDVSGLSPEDRAALATLHDSAAVHTSRRRINPSDFTPRRVNAAVIPHGYGSRPWEDQEALLASADSIKQLDLPPRYLNPLLRYGLCTVSELVELMARGECELMVIPRIGYSARLAIRAAVEKYTDVVDSGRNG
jgi:hypothetical protein